jgi:acetate kinase
MKILIINAGSSSVKFSLFDMPAESAQARGIVERIGLENTQLKWQCEEGFEIKQPIRVQDTRDAIKVIIELLVDAAGGVLTDRGPIQAVGHRVLHGGDKVNQTVLVDRHIKAIIQEFTIWGPLHNPPNLMGIEACEQMLPGVPQVAVFDTAFHSTIPEHAYLYALPLKYYSKYKIRRYGFHGISHGYVAEQAARLIAKPLDQQRSIICHLGNGCSISAVQGGFCRDTSMGLTPLEGLVMGTRCGDIDPALVYFLMERYQMDFTQIQDLLNRKSGLLGLAGIGSSDLRDIIAAQQGGNRHADMALKIFVYRIKKYIGAYMAVLGGLDALIFTGGIGENVPQVRASVCEGFGGENGMGIDLDEVCNIRKSDGIREIQSPQSRVKILVIQTNEELAIGRQTYKLLGRLEPTRSPDAADENAF